MSQQQFAARGSSKTKSQQPTVVSPAALLTWSLISDWRLTSAASSLELAGGHRSACSLAFPSTSTGGPLTSPQRLGPRGKVTADI